MKRLISISLALAVCGAPGAGATVVFDNLTNISSVGADGWSNTSHALAASFYSPGPVTGGTVVMSLQAADPTDSGSATVYLVPDDGSGGAAVTAGMPAFTAGGSGAVDAFSGATAVGTVYDNALQISPGLVTFALPSAGTTGNGEYWIGLLLSPGSTLGWAYSADGSGVGTAGQSYFNDAGNSPGAAPDSQGSYQMIVDVPEPATLGILLAGLAALAGLPRSRCRI